MYSQKLVNDILNGTVKTIEPGYRLGSTEAFISDDDYPEDTPGVPRNVYGIARPQHVYMVDKSYTGNDGWVQQMHFIRAECFCIKDGVAYIDPEPPNKRLHGTA